MPCDHDINNLVILFPIHSNDWMVSVTVLGNIICLQVEHIIREDYMVEALEIIELYCDMLLARFGLIETMRFA